MCRLGVREFPVDAMGHGEPGEIPKKGVLGHTRSLKRFVQLGAGTISKKGGVGWRDMLGGNSAGCLHSQVNPDLTAQGTWLCSQSLSCVSLTEAWRPAGRP